MNLPKHLTPVEALTAPVQVSGEVREKIDGDGMQKRSNAFESRPGWVVPVEIVKGTRQKALADGTSVTVMDVEQIGVTVWNNAKPQAVPGDYVSLVSPMVGAFDGATYVQALGVERYHGEQDQDDLADLLGGAS